MNNAPIGVFDSGQGGLSVWSELYRRLPHESLLYYGDGKNCPYGNQPRERIVEYSDYAVRRMLSVGVKMVVIACNTATAAAIDHLRTTYDVPFVGLEPAVKPAVLTSRSGVVGILATAASAQRQAFPRDFPQICGPGADDRAGGRRVRRVGRKRSRGYSRGVRNRIETARADARTGGGPDCIGLYALSVSLRCDAARDRRPRRAAGQSRTCYRTARRGAVGGVLVGGRGGSRARVQFYDQCGRGVPLPVDRQERAGPKHWISTEGLVGLRRMDLDLRTSSDNGLPGQRNGRMQAWYFINLSKNIF